jgi:hypothetical protein
VIRRTFLTWAPISDGSPKGDRRDGSTETGRTTFLDELTKGKLLFFLFTDTNTGGPVACVDGKERSARQGSVFGMGEVDRAGLLIRLSKSKHTIDSAIHTGGADPGPAPSVDLTDCGVLDEAMVTFVRRFITR